MREAKVGHHRPHTAALLGHQHDVGGLEVAVDHARPMRRRQSLDHLADDGQGLALAHRPVAQPRFQGPPRQQLHGEEGHPLLAVAMMGDVENPADVRVGDLARQVDLARETLESSWHAGDLGAHRLQRHAPADLFVLRLVDVSHAPMAQETNDPEPFGQQLPRGESAAGGGYWPDDHRPVVAPGHGPADGRRLGRRIGRWRRAGHAHAVYRGGRSPRGRFLSGNEGYCTTGPGAEVPVPSSSGACRHSTR